MPKTQKHTYNTGIIGNCSYLAHVDNSGRLVWLCWPRFDSPSVFAHLLDPEKGGHFSVLPHSGKYTSTQHYRQNTNVLVTEIETAEGKYRITDFAPRFQEYERYFKPLMLVRKIEPIEGHPIVKVECRPMGSYGTVKPEVQIGSNHIRYAGLDQQIRLTTNFSLNYVVSEQPTVLNETKYLVLTWGIPLEAPLESTAEEFLRKTVAYWRDWVKRATIGNFQQEAVVRSALALKIHQYEDTGAIIAASTTSLPEYPGSGRTWDYRYCWMRDTYYTLNALNNIGHFEEMERYAHYIENIAMSEKRERYRPLYSLSGEGELIERTVDLAGYLGNQPVRVGNQAYEHIQNDVYGQVLVSLLPLYVDRRFVGRLRATSRTLVNQILDQIDMRMDEPDASLWEFRGLAQRNCYTYLFHWAGASAAMKIAGLLGDDAMATRAADLKKRAAVGIEACFDPQVGAYTQGIGTKNLDASCLQLISMRYLNPKSEIAANHLSALERELMTEDGLFYRYKHADDFGKPKATFLVCTFWYIEALVCVGRVDDAIAAFEKIMGYTNHLGLLSEDVESGTGSQWGNFPQAYSHVGMMNAAFRIERALDLPSFV